MYVFDCGSHKIVKHTAEEEKAKEVAPLLTVKTNNTVVDSKANGGLSPMRKGNNAGLSPARKGANAGASPSRKAQPHHHTNSKKDHDKDEEHKVLTSPTSLQMSNSFIIKNADTSFDSYYHTMKKRKQGALDGSVMNASLMSTAKFGVVAGKMPTARDGHSSSIDKEGNMYVFGGDRHHMPFNDLYMIKL